MAATTSGMEVPTKGNVYEMQQPVNGEHSPAEENDMLASYEGEAPQDGADMYRLGRKQQLQVGESQRLCTCELHARKDGITRLTDDSETSTHSQPSV